MSHRFLRTAVFALALTAPAAAALAHCQVPCGIYDDDARLAAMREDAVTIGKAVTQIRQLAGAHDATAFNQASRWVTTKEEHASRIITTVSEYFLTQKVKAPNDDTEGAREHYHRLLADHHAVMKAAMKTKQTVNSADVTALNEAIAALAHHYVEQAPAATQTQQRLRRR